ncbi:MAG TPA: peptidoglycan-binding domain-containing protein [Acidobacteriaceae bacterium]|nr:peptidoglycan-binding domain-containing protein [Acidobacteriaceae bacterium]
MARLKFARSCAGTLVLALGLAGMVYASSTGTSAKKAHATARLRREGTKRTRTSSSHKVALRHTGYRTRHRRYRRRHAAIRGQRVMDPSRASEIQQALVQAHYLNGSPTGQWDAETQAAMVKYQSDNGWQTKITPDSRALIKLGLGPKQDAGEYSARPAGMAETSSEASPSTGTPTDNIRTMATSEIPMTTSAN